MCCLSVLSFHAQLCNVPDEYMDEVMSWALKFMFGPRDWIRGARGHAFFRARMDLNMQSVTRCPKSTMSAVLYNTTIRFLADFQTQLHTLDSCTVSLDATLHFLAVRERVKRESPSFHSKLMNQLVDTCNLEDRITLLLQDSAKASQAVYVAFFNHFHPVGSLHILFQHKLRKRWCKPHLLNDVRIPHLASLAIRNLNWLSRHVPPRVHTSNIRFHLNGWHTRRRYQQEGACLFCAGANTIDSIEHFVFCQVLHNVLPMRLKVEGQGHVPVTTWFLYSLGKPDTFLMALYIHAFYTVHNLYRHSADWTEIKLLIERIILDIPMRQQLRKFVKSVIHGRPSVTWCELHGTTNSKVALSMRRGGVQWCLRRDLHRELWTRTSYIFFSFSQDLPALTGRLDPSIRIAGVIIDGLDDGADTFDMMTRCFQARILKCYF